MTAKIKGYQFFLTASLLVVCLAILNLFGPDVLKIVSGFLLAVIVPGASISSLFFTKTHSRYNLFLVVGQSISFVMGIGLILSLTRLHTGILTPLYQTPMVLIISGWSLFLLLLSTFIKRYLTITVSIPLKKILISLLFLNLPILSVFGTSQLNSNGPPAITLTVLILLPILGFALAYGRNRTLIRQMYPFYIYSMALALQWLLSLRSSHISGYDISLEYKVFMLTKNLGYWNFEAFKSAYNACLSITIFPTVLSSLIPIQTEYIYKGIFPILFALVPVILYKTWEEKLQSVRALLASFFFMSFPWFIDPLTTLTRQQIAFFFLSLLVFLIFNSKINKYLRYFSFYVFAAALVLSHYSTTYISIAMFGIAIAIACGVFIMKKIPPFRVITSKLHIPLFSIEIKDLKLLNPLFFLYLCLISFVWYSVMTGTSKNIKDLYAKTVSNFRSSDSSLYSGMIAEVKSLFGKKVTSHPYTDFQAEKVKQFSDKFPTTAIPMQRAQVIPRVPDVTPVVSPQAYAIAKKIFTFLTLFSALMPPVAGIVAILGFKIREIEREHWLSSLWVSAYILIAAIILIPYISIGYNFERIFMQSMLITTIAPVLILLFIAKLTQQHRFPYAFFFGIIALFFYFNYGVIWHFTGGKPVMWLDNKGISYDLTYTHDGEVAAAKFLVNKGSGENIHTSSKGRNILTAYANPKSISTETLSLLIVPGSYIFSHYANVTNKLDYFSWSGSPNAYTYQSDDFDNRFNLIYSNHAARLYK